MPRALIVDDKEENLYLLTAVLKAHGFDVDAAHDGAAALVLARANPPAIVISDILMPRMDGFSLCRHWHEDPALCAIPFVFYTATYTDERDEKLALELGADRFLLKPLEPDAFWSAIEEVLQQVRERRLPEKRVEAGTPQVLLREYNSALVRKLEDKLLELETAKRKLSHSEELLNSTLDSLPSLVVILDADAEILMVNQPAGHSFPEDCPFLVNVRLDHSYTRICHKLLVPSDADSLIEGVKKVIQGTLVEFSSEVACCLHPEKRWYSVRALPLRSHAGKVIVTHTDITSQRAAEERNAALERQLQAGSKMEALGRLAGGIAHEFNNLLTVINGYSLRLLSTSPSGDPATQPLQQIHTAGERAAALTGQMLAFCSNQLASPKPFDLNSIVTEMVGMLEPLVGEKIRISTKLEAQSGTVLVDHNQMAQVIMNLGANARDAMPNGGTLVLETRNEDVAGRSDVPAGSYASLAVTDSGTGIDPKTLPSIFEPFFTTKERGRGTGLGLATVHGIVRQNGGWIVVDSVVGKGTSFKIYLPRTNAKAGPLPARESTPEARPKGQGTILVVEDQEQIRDLVVFVLKDLGYHLVAAPNGEACLKLAQELDEIDLVITDVVLPKMSGPELVERLLERQPQLKVLYISGYPKDLVMTGALKTTGLVYLQKPFSPMELAAKVEAILL